MFCHFPLFDDEDARPFPPYPVGAELRAVDMTSRDAYALISKLIKTRSFESGPAGGSSGETVRVLIKVEFTNHCEHYAYQASRL